MSIDFLDFLTQSPSVYHAADEIVRRLTKQGFQQLTETKPWKLSPESGFFIVRDGSLVAAFRTPRNTPSKAKILASHIDSPGIKLKPKPEIISHKMGQLSTEIYGSPLLHTWLDRDLALAGKISYVTESGHLESKTIHLIRHPLIIPSLAIHLDRSLSDKGLMINKQEHLKPIFSLDSKGNELEKLLKEETKAKQIIAYDLFLVPLQTASLTGFSKEMVCSYRLDNLSSAYASLQAILDGKPQDTTLQIALFWDHEEIGSLTGKGADSSFTIDLLERICLHYGKTREEFFQLKQNSLCISSDLSHGIHPNFGEKYDIPNAPSLGKGVVMKCNANQKYATHSLSSAPILYLAEKHKIPMQVFACRSDIPCGSTVGPIMAARSGIPTIDLGIASLAMHSIRETISLDDQYSLHSLLQKIIEEDLQIAEEK
jgi:aspartyl aminopeptidase